MPTASAAHPTPAARAVRVVSWLAALWIAWEFLHYEQYKLTGNPGSVYLFTVLSDWLGTPGGEKPFRLFVATLEIIASVLVVLPWTRLYGAALSLGLMSGAIFFHLVTPLGIDPYGDGGVLFKQAIFTWVVAALLLVLHRAELFALLARLGLLPAHRAAA